MVQNKVLLKAEIFNQLALMEKAGMPLIDAIDSLQPVKDIKLKHALSSLASRLKRGQPLAEAGLASGIFSDVDGLLVKAASEAGKLEVTLKRIAVHYDLQYKLYLHVKSRLLYPLVIFVLAIFIEPLPGLVTGSISLLVYLQATVWFLIKLSAVIYIAYRLPYWLRKGPLQGPGQERLVDRLMLRIPVAGKIYLRHQVTKFYETLGMLLQAGIPAFEAVPDSVKVIDNTVIRSAFEPVMLKLRQHATLADALAVNRYLSPDSIQHIRAGELSGRLDESLLHYGDLARAEVNLHIEQLAFWIPFAVYIVICIYMLNSIIGSGVFLPSVDY